MRNRDFDDLTGIRATEDERPYASPADPERIHGGMRASSRGDRNAQGAGLLWAVCGALILAMIGLGYWSHQEQTRLRSQLVATQASFARISEQAANRLEDITGKVSATESSITEVEQSTRAVEGLDMRLRELVQRVNTQAQILQQLEQGRLNLAASGEAQRTTLDTLGTRAAELAGRLEAFDAHADSVIAQMAAMQAQVDTLDGRVAALDQISRQLNAQSQELAEQQKRIEALGKRVDGVDVQRELVAVRSELDQRLASLEQELRSIDSFRIQTNRTLSTLQTQIRTVQQGTQP